MKKSLRLIVTVILVISCAFISSGCYDIVELDQISIATGIAVDKDQNNSIRLTVQVGKAAAVGGGGEVGGGDPGDKPYQLLDAVNPNVIGAFDDLRQDNSRTLFLHHNQVLIFGKSRAESGIIVDIDAFMRDQQTRMDVYILIADGDAKDILDVEMELEKIPSTGIKRMIENKTKISKAFGVKLLEFVSKLTDKITAPVAPIIKIAEEPDSKRLSLKGLAVFKGDKMVGQLSEYQSKGYVWVVENLKSGSLPVKTGQDSAELNIINVKSEYKPSFDEKGIPKMTVDITGQFAIGQLIGFKGKKLEEVLLQLQKNAADTIKGEILSCFKETQKLNTDIFGFGSHINKYHKQKWKAIEDKWDKIYPSLELSLNIQVDIKDTGKIAISPEMFGGR